LTLYEVRRFLTVRLHNASNTSSEQPVNTAECTVCQNEIYANQSDA